ncbi:MAG: alkaline phosphatase family protein [Bacteroidetes bacterium]|nr:MAG: alkaline phosphatase family protein [Bacteroidota bacterium]
MRTRSLLKTNGFLVVALLLVASCRSQNSEPNKEPSQDPVSENTVILISIDGFRSDYVQKFEPPNISRLAHDGVTSEEGMIPIFPTLTFPLHYSMATGLYPQNHGIISNTMFDPRSGKWFRISDRESVEDPGWWEGEPIWVTAENQGMIAATFFFVGSETPVKGVQPTYWERFDASVPGNTRVDQVLAWLDLPIDERPEFIALYFGQVDGEGHANGPDAPEMAESVLEVDGYIGRLLEGLAARGIEDGVNVILVSDHGMSARSQSRVIALDDYMDMDEVDVINTSPVLMMNAKGNNASQIVEQLQGAHPELEVWMKRDVPERFHFRDHYRIPDIIGMVSEGWTIYRTREYMEENLSRLGGATHGYDPAALSMRALFVAHGPAFRENVKIEPFENIHLYALMAHILELDPAETDGSLDVLSPILKK